MLSSVLLLREPSPFLKLCVLLTCFVTLYLLGIFNFIKVLLYNPLIALYLCLRRNPLTESTNLLIECALTNSLIQSVLYIEKPFALEQANSLLQSDC